MMDVDFKDSRNQPANLKKSFEQFRSVSCNYQRYRKKLTRSRGKGKKAEKVFEEEPNKCGSR